MEKTIEPFETAKDMDSTKWDDNSNNDDDEGHFIKGLKESGFSSLASCIDAKFSDTLAMNICDVDISACLERVLEWAEKVKETMTTVRLSYSHIEKEADLETFFGTIGDDDVYHITSLELSFCSLPENSFSHIFSTKTFQHLESLNLSLGLKEKVDSSQEKYIYEPKEEEWKMLIEKLQSLQHPLKNITITQTSIPSDIISDIFSIDTQELNLSSSSFSITDVRSLPKHLKRLDISLNKMEGDNPSYSHFLELLSSSNVEQVYAYDCGFTEEMVEEFLDSCKCILYLDEEKYNEGMQMKILERQKEGEGWEESLSDFDLYE